MSYIYLQNSPVLFVSLCSFIGLMIGSFLNVVIYRLPKRLAQEWLQQRPELHGAPVDGAPLYSILTPRSACPECGHKITWLENIPLVSYVVLRGRCSQCRASISARYPVVEGLTGFISGFTAWHFGCSSDALAGLIFVWAMLALAFIDIETQLLPDEITLPLLWGGLLVNLDNTFTDIRSAVVGAAAGYAVLWSVYWCFRLVTGKEGIGHGDFKLFALIGAWLGWQMLSLVLLFSSLLGSLVGIGLIMTRKQGRNDPIPFGPYLVAGGFIALYWGNQLNHFYLE